MNQHAWLPNVLVSACLLALLAAGCARPTVVTLLPAAPTAPSAPVCPEIAQGIAFLRERYNPTIGLLNESPEVAPHVYWLSNDNVLAAFALERMGEPDLAGWLLKNIQRYGQPSNGLIEVLWGEAAAFPPYVAQNVTLERIGDDLVMQEKHLQGSRFEDWREYADLALWGALNAYQQGQPAEAGEIFASTMKLHDGLGFKDKAFSDQYETYKLALALYVGSEIQAEIPGADALRAAIIAMQREDGGFVTHYQDLSHPTGDANTETTALALLALWESCH